MIPTTSSSGIITCLENGADMDETVLNDEQDRSCPVTLSSDIDSTVFHSVLPMFQPTAHDDAGSMHLFASKSSPFNSFSSVKLLEDIFSSKLSMSPSDRGTIARRGVPNEVASTVAANSPSPPVGSFTSGDLSLLRTLSDGTMDTRRRDSEVIVDATPHVTSPKFDPHRTGDNNVFNSAAWGLDQLHPSDLSIDCETAFRDVPVELLSLPTNSKPPTSHAFPRCNTSLLRTLSDATAVKRRRDSDASVDTPFTLSTTIFKSDRSMDNGVFNSTAWGLDQVQPNDLSLDVSYVLACLGVKMNGQSLPPITSSTNSQISTSAPRFDFHALFESQLMNTKPVAPVPAATTKPKRTKKRTYKRPSYEPETKVYVVPNNMDVLLGRGGRSNHHVGNQRYLRAKIKIQPKYLASSKEEKTNVSQELVDIVHGWGGRFLKQEAKANGKWYEVKNIMARKKASQALREVKPGDEEVDSD